MTGWTFLAEVSRRTECYLLLDPNAIVFSTHNHGFGADDYMKGLRLDRIRQIHLAGHTPGPVGDPAFTI